MDVRDVATLATAQVTRADICIVGSGPAGLTLARELAGSGMSVLILESGSREQDPWADSLNRIESVGEARVMDQSLVRNRRIGGTSTTWSGRLATMDELDFAPRPWVTDSGWPIPRSELSQYFERSLAHLGGSVADNNDAELLAHFRSDSPAWNTQVLQPYVWSYSRDPDNPGDFMRFGPRALNHRDSDAFCVTGATVTRILADDGQATGVEVTARDLKKHRVDAGTVVLCAGAIENARLLLVSGLGNDHDLVGRYLADHPRGLVARFEPKDSAAIQRIFSSRLARIGGRSTTLTLGAALSPGLQESEGLLNCSVWTSGTLSARDPLVALRAVLRQEPGLAGNARTVLLGAGNLGRGAARALFARRSPVRVMTDLGVQGMVEQEPNRDSRVSLSKERDELGMPISVVDWRIGSREAATVRRMTEVFAGELRRLGYPVPKPTEMIADPEAPFHLPDVAHPSGTTRMSLEPTRGVVDTDSAVHGMTGLYVAGSSIFPTNGHANPTQMIVAMTVRLADHVKSRYRAQS